MHDIESCFFIRGIHDKMRHSIPSLNPIFPYRPDLDGLRAIAILSVMYAHFFDYSGHFNGGMGVDMFFVLSGYLITAIILRQWEQGTFCFQDFYARRIRRLFPTLIITFIGVWVGSWIFLNPLAFRLMGGTLAASGLSGMNYLLSSGMDFFHISAKFLPFGQLWSLSLEEQFYLIFPWILLSMTRVQSLIRWRIPLFMIIALLSWVYYFIFRNYIGQTYYDPLARSWELLMGVCLALSWKNWEFWKHKIACVFLRFWRSSWGPSSLFWIIGMTIGFCEMSTNIQTILFFISFMALGLFFRHRYIVLKKTPTLKNATVNAMPSDTIFMAIGLYLVLTGLCMSPRHYPVCFAAIFSTLGTACIIASGPSQWVNQSILSNPILVYIGKISYALYVIHYPLYILCNLYYGQVVHDMGILSLLFFSSFVLAASVYAYVEKPTRYGKYVWPWIVAMGLCVGMGYLSYNQSIMPMHKEALYTPGL